MASRGKGRGPSNRMNVGTAILTAARGIDTAPVKARLSAFIDMHRSYAGAQGKVGTAESELRAAQAKLEQRSAEIDASVEALAVALAHEGQPRLTPFAAFGMSTPGEVRHLAAGRKAQAVHQLVAQVQHTKGMSQKTRDTAQAAEQTARSVDAACLAVGQLRATLRDRRRQRDALGSSWDTALAALRREAQSAVADGAAGLYSALFGAATARSTRRNGKSTPVQEHAPISTPTPEANPAPTPVSTA